MASVYQRGSRNRPNWWARIKEQGKWVAHPTRQTTKAAALKVAQEMQASVLRGELALPEDEPADQPAEPHTIRNLVDHFLAKYRRGKIKDIEAYRKTSRSVFDNRVLPYMGDLPAATLRAAQIEQWLTDMDEDGYGPGSINGAIAHVCKLYGWANKMELINCRNPIAGMERQRVEPLNEHLTLEQVHKVLALPELPPMVATGLYTGMRRGELYGLCWSAVRLPGPRPYFDVCRSFDGPTKNGSPRMIPIHAELLPRLRDWQRRCPTPNGLVFPVIGALGPRMGSDNPNDLGGIREAFTAAKLDQAAGYKHPWHALRHTFATLAIEAGVARDAVEQMLGHRSAGNAVTSGYIHTGLPYLVTEMAKLALHPPASAGVASMDEHRRLRSL